MDILESLLRGFDTNVVSGVVLILMLFVFGLGCSGIVNLATH